MWCAFKKHDGKVVVANSMELKAKDISCSRWEMRSDSVGILVAEIWVDSVVIVERHSKSTDFEDGLGQWFIKRSYGFCSSLRVTGGEKENFWNEVFHLVSCIPQNEVVVLAGDMNGYIGSSNVGYDKTHGGFGYGDRNADSST